jgi:hypothetical protein
MYIIKSKLILKNNNPELTFTNIESKNHFLILY